MKVKYSKQNRTFSCSLWLDFKCTPSSKTSLSKEMSSLTKSFFESTGSDQNAGGEKQKAFVSYLIKSEDMLPSDSLGISWIITINEIFPLL